MTEPRIVKPQEAQSWVGTTYGWVRDLAYTVATAPEREEIRTRAVVVKALRANDYRNPQFGQVADAIENGADYA